jgi:hypothetical protein
VVTETRSIEKFAKLLDEAGGGRHRRVETDAELVSMVHLARRLAAVPEGLPAAMDPRPRESFRDDLRAQLVRSITANGTAAAAKNQDARGGERILVPAPRREPDATQPIAKVTALRDPHRRTRTTRTAVILGVAFGALALSGVSMASNGAAPGDALYGVKRSNEQVQVALAGSDANRGRLHLEFAKIRLAEARKVDPARVPAVLADMDREVVEGARLVFAAALPAGDLPAIDAVRAFAQQQRAELMALIADLAQAAQPARASLDLLTEIETRADLLRAAIAAGCTTTTTDDLGPLPRC